MKTFNTLFRPLSVIVTTFLLFGCTTVKVLDLAIPPDKYLGLEIQDAWQMEDQRVVLNAAASYSNKRRPQQVTLLFDREAGQLSNMAKPDWMPEKIEVEGQSRPVHFGFQHGLQRPIPTPKHYDFSTAQPVRMVTGEEKPLRIKPGETLVIQSPHGGRSQWFLHASPSAAEIQAIRVTHRNLGFTPTEPSSVFLIAAPFVVPVTLAIDFAMLFTLPIREPLSYHWGN